VDKGYDGFEVLTSFRFLNQAGALMSAPPPAFDGSVMVPPIYKALGQGSSRLPTLEGDIKLLHAPLSGAPPEVFDAPKLIDALKSIVEGAKCDLGNVCPHPLDYLGSSSLKVREAEKRSGKSS
jgi:hypothetical protein